MVGYKDLAAELAANDVSVLPASVDPIDKAKEVADEIGMPVGYGVTRAIADQLGSWWEERRQIIQPSEFIVGPGDKVLAASYSDGPVGRLLAHDALALVKFVASRK